MYRAVFTTICILLVGVGYAATQANLSGTWILQPTKSTADLSQLQGNRLVISQTGDAVSFGYYRDTNPVSSETIVANGISKQRYKTRMYVAYDTARWEKGALVVETEWVLNNEGTQTYTSTERWEVSKNGRTLYKKTSDGAIVFSRQEAPASSSSAPHTNSHAGHTMQAVAGFVRGNRLGRTDLDSGSITYRLNKWITFVHEVSYIATFAAQHDITKAPLFEGRHTFQAHNWRNGIRASVYVLEST